MLVLRHMQAHGNFGEYVPLALLLLALAEGNNAAPAVVIGALGTVLVLARFSHAWGIAVKDANFMLRFLGTVGTISTINILTGIHLWNSARTLLRAAS